MCGGGWVWAEQVVRLHDALDCISYDRRGHSRSGSGRLGQANAVHADDAAALIDTLDLAPCLVVGSSAGACIGLELCLRYPHLVRGAVLSEPPQFTLLDAAAGAAIKAEIGSAVRAGVERGGPCAAVDAFFDTMCPGLWTTIDELRRDRYRANAATLLAALAEPPTTIARAQLRDVAVPVLVVTGRRSHPALRAITRLLVDELSDARLVDLPGCGHVTYAERPAEFARAVSAFTAELVARGDTARETRTSRVL